VKVCFIGLDNLPVLAPEFNAYGVGGEQVQHTLLAKALARRGHDVSMVVYDYGQPDRARWDGVTTYKAYRADSGLPMVRFVHPRWTGVWSALKRADADVYYASCAGMHLGLLAMFCRKENRRFVFRIAHDSDCDPDNLLIKYWRDRRLYEYGLRRASGILAQSEQQQRALMKNYGLQSDLADMLVEAPKSQPARDVDVLWVNNLRPFKRPDLFLELARRLPRYRFHMVGGKQPGHEDLYDEISVQAREIPNLEFHGPVPYHDIGPLYARARVFVNTSDSEGFPNSYLQAWVRGTPVLAFFDPDGVIRRRGLGDAVESIDRMAARVDTFLRSPALWSGSSAACIDYMRERYAEERILAPYLRLFAAEA